MSREQFEIIFDGPALSEHKMDVRDLGPALLGLGDAIRLANQKLNGERATVNVYVQSRFEHGCFQVNMEVVQTLEEVIRGFLQDDTVRNAKDILEWIGIFTGFAGVSVLSFYKVRRGRQLEGVEETRNADGGGTVSVKIEGETNPVVINQNIYNVSNDPKFAAALGRFIETAQKPGIEEIEIRKNGEKAEIPRSDASEISASCNAVAVQPADGERNEVIASLTPHAPTFDPRAEKWRFKFGGKAISADISDTNIARAAIERGTVGMNDVYRVRLEIVERRTPSGQFRHDYKVLEVLSFTQGMVQREIFDYPAPQSISDSPQPRLPSPKDSETS